MESHGTKKGASVKAKSCIKLKLLIDSRGQRVLYAEAGKDFVDFLFTLMSLPVGTVINLLSSNAMVGSLGKLYQSIENLDDTLVQPNVDKETLLNPKAQALNGANPNPLLLPNSNILYEHEGKNMNVKIQSFFRCPSSSPSFFQSPSSSPSLFGSPSSSPSLVASSPSFFASSSPTFFASSSASSFGSSSVASSAAPCFASSFASSSVPCFASSSVASSTGPLFGSPSSLPSSSSVALFGSPSSSPSLFASSSAPSFGSPSSSSPSSFGSPSSSPFLFSTSSSSSSCGCVEGGFVKGVVSYMVMDDLEVSPMSTISSIAILKKLDVKEVGALQEKMVSFGMNEGLKLLNAALQSKTVLSDVFLGKEATTKI